MIKPHSYVDVLINQGLADSAGLKSRVSAWLKIFDSWQPSVIIADHSPTVLLAQRLYAPTPCIAAGNGFAVPPLNRPFPLFDEQFPYSEETLIVKEDDLLQSVINPVLRDLGGNPMSACQDLFAPHFHWLFGVSELDHYRCPRSQTFLGASPAMGGVPATWPEAPGRQVFLYAKTHRAMPHLLNVLKELRWPTLIYAPGWPADLQRVAAAPNIHLSEQPLDLADVSRHCDLAISNGGVNGVVELLAHGIPQLLLPLHIEQLMVTRSAQTTGAVLGLTFDPKKPDSLVHVLTTAADPAGPLKKAAIRFSENHAANRATVQAGDLLAQLEAMSEGTGVETRV